MAHCKSNMDIVHFVRVWKERREKRVKMDRQEELGPQEKLYVPKCKIDCHREMLCEPFTLLLGFER